VEGELAAPPASPSPGQAWLVGATPTGTFAGHSAAIAGWTASGWRFVEAVVGLRVFDKSAGCFRHFADTWQTPIAPLHPTAGSTIDVEARAAIVSILERLGEAGVFATN
jgi:hypothetical protein